MSTGPTPITLQTNLRKLEPASDFKLQDLLHCRVDIQHDADTLPAERVPETEHKKVRSATMKYVAKPDFVLSSINERSFFAGPEHRETVEHDVSRQAFLLTIHNGQDDPPATLANLDYASLCASGGPAPNIVFETKASKFERSYLSNEKYRWCSTQIITSNVSRAELRIALQRIALAVGRESKGSASVYCHSLVVRCQILEVARLLPSVAAGEDFVNSSAGIDVPWIGTSKLVVGLMSSPIPPTDSKCARYSEGLKLLPGTSPSLYLNGAPRSFIAKKPHVFITTDPRLRTLADLFDEQLNGTDDRGAKLKQLSITLKGLQVRVRGSKNSNDDETHIVGVVLVDNSRPAPFRPRQDLPLIAVGSAQYPIDPELCIIVPNQDLRGRRMSSVARLIENIRRSDVPTTSATTGSLSGWSISPRQDKNKIDNLRAVSIKFDGALPKILFLEAATEDVNSPSWNLVRQKLKEEVQRRAVSAPWVGSPSMTRGLVRQHLMCPQRSGRHVY
jgi:hypothetical protein